jgi:dTDP-4-dehydrorhamnose 3,5-epimerase
VSNNVDNNSPWFISLEKHQTKSIVDGHINGSLTVIWRDWDNIMKNHPKMVYVSSINRGEIKGPHLHKKRNSYFVCIHGKAVFVIKEHDGKYLEIESSDEKPVLVYVPKGYSSAHINLSNEISRVLVLADLAWRPNDNEMENVQFDDYNWKKWQQS